MPLSTIFQLYHGSQFYLWRKPQYPEKTISLSQVIDNFYRDDPMITTMKAPSRIEKTGQGVIPLNPGTSQNDV
jgi:hypothetical protein